MSIRFGQHELDEQRFVLLHDGLRLKVRPKVFDLLVHLVRNHERVVLRDELIMALWGTTAVGLGSLAGLVNELRQLLGESGRGPSSIRTVHARGYQFVAEITATEAREVGPPSSARTTRDEIGEASDSTVGHKHGHTSGHASGNGRVESGLDPLAAARALIRTSSARVSIGGARAVLVEGRSGSERSNLLDQISVEITHAGFQTHHLLVESRSEWHSNALVDRLIDALVEHHGIEAIRSAIPIRARELRERAGGMGSVSNARPRDPLASRQYDERVWRSAAELLGELARQRPLALIMDDHDQTITVRALTSLLHLLGKARVFIVCTVAVAKSGESGIADQAASRIEYVRLPPSNRNRLNELLESRGATALPVVLADALLAHVGHDDASLESIAEWLQSDRERGAPASDDSVMPQLNRQMRRVEPDTASRRPRSGRP
jgi:DNA-binding winged helix-turn-helix (wHTH) protein